ncbi:peptidoglycan-binding domain-containing protein [Ideonella sp.]|uniref:peptidoglycan-binding domain-containing protein n=1 Tax=Ideonella sp. TaxID=1929293 RepID=UPI0039C8B059
MSNSEAQRILTQLGFRPGPVDGTFGERTVSALISFQREKGLIPTGKLDHETIEALRAAKRSL